VVKDNILKDNSIKSTLRGPFKFPLQRKKKKIRKKGRKYKEKK
jgi:hypothetical protein